MASAISFRAAKRDDNEKLVVTPTFTLRGVDLLKVLEDYEKGTLQNLVPQEKVKVKSNNIFGPSFGTSIDDKFYSYRDKANCQQRIVTTNQLFYTYVRTGGPPPKADRCDWCNDPAEGIPIGIPIRITITPTNQITITPTKYQIHLEAPYYCCYECCLAAIHREQNTKMGCRDVLYSNSEQYLKFMYSINFPDEPPLRPAKDRRLHHNLHGPLTSEMFHTKRHNYTRLSNVITLAPAKIEYMMIFN